MRDKLERKKKPLKRLPVGAMGPTFQLPLIASPLEAKKYSNRKVQVINTKNFKRGGNVLFSENHQGTLKVKNLKQLF